MPKGYIYRKLGSSGPGPYSAHAGWRNNRPPDLEATVRRGAHVGWHRNEGNRNSEAVLYSRRRRTSHEIAMPNPIRFRSTCPSTRYEPIMTATT